MKGEYGGIWGEEGNADYGGVVKPRQQHVAPCAKVIEWGFGTRGLRLYLGGHHSMLNVQHINEWYHGYHCINEYNVSLVFGGTSFNVSHSTH